MKCPYYLDEYSEDCFSRIRFSQGATKGSSITTAFQHFRGRGICKHKLDTEVSRFHIRRDVPDVVNQISRDCCQNIEGEGCGDGVVIHCLAATEPAPPYTSSATRRQDKNWAACVSFATESLFKGASCEKG